MPKEIIEINPFHGGMNENSDARDLAHDELASAVDVMVDKIGRIRTGPSIDAHASASPSPPTTDDIDDRTRTSLFAFSSDYSDGGTVLGDIIKNGSSNQNSGSYWGGWSASSTNWVATSGDLRFTGSTGGSSTITQTAANRISPGYNSKSYILTYTISGYSLTSGTPFFKLLGGSGQFANTEQSLTLSNGTHTKTFTSHSSATTGVFSLEAADIQMSFRIDDIKLELSLSNNTPDDYLVMYLNTSATNYGFAIYSYNDDSWVNPGTVGMQFNSVSTSAEPVFTYADGVLRVVDKLKGQNCNKIWYGYVDRYRWGTTTVFARGWVNCESFLTAPTNATVPFETGGGGPYTPAEGEFKFGVPYGFTTNTANAGGWNPNGVIGTATAGSGADKLVSSSTTFTTSMVGMRVRRSNNTTATAIITGFESADIIHCSKIIADSESTTQSGTLTWSSSSNDEFQIYDYYELGITFVYDGNQESLIHNRKTFGQNNIKNWVFWIQAIACGHNWDSSTTARITGVNLYYRKESDNTNTWYHLAEVDLNKGLRLSNEDDFSITWSEATAGTEYLLNNIYIPNPLNFETYESRNGYRSDITSLLDLSDDYTGYSASVIANRTHYIANVKYANKEGIVRNYGDVMFKSSVNKFDTFPLNKKLEVTVQDGDEITALAAYADRVLQFKKTKMHLINVSQEVEFLEDTFKFKGCYDQSAVCNTDYGIAWVNTFGAYLYDGQKVHNLVEQKGVRKIAPTQSNVNRGFVYNKNFRPMIAYLPHERQLFIAKDGSTQDEAAGAGNAWIYDMITQSWVLQKQENFVKTDGKGASNLVTDHLGNIVYFIGTGSMKTVNTSSASKTAIDIKTADMNFGDSGVRKKVYRVRLSYKGDASSLNVRYTTNGDTDGYKQFEGTSSGLPNGSATNTPLENKSSDVTQWHHAELKPAVSSESTNIYSFQVHMSGTAGATFEINDLSVVFRVKNVK